MPDRPRHVVVIEDDPAVRDALRFALRLEGFDITAHDAAAGLLAAADGPPIGCVVLSEAPQTDGMAVFRVLRDRGIAAPVILLTGHATPRLLAAAAAAGIGLVLEKPLLDNDLIDGIHAILAAPDVPDTP